MFSPRDFPLDQLLISPRNFGAPQNESWDSFLDRFMIDDGMWTKELNAFNASMASAAQEAPKVESSAVQSDTIDSDLSMLVDLTLKNSKDLELPRTNSKKHRFSAALPRMKSQGGVYRANSAPSAKTSSWVQQAEGLLRAQSTSKLSSKQPLDPSALESQLATDAARKPPSRYCHLCWASHRHQKLVICSNWYVDGKCRKVECERCIQREIEQSGGPLDANRPCRHCRGVCPEKAQCASYKKYNQARGEQRAVKRMLRMAEKRTQDSVSIAQQPVALADPAGFAEIDWF
uniref:Zinc-finger domain-containing protein n=1 Tax=Erythrolobus australicus TaxID=1077150 RepID=A0A7S1TND7_9RHOD|mmetsp:Transcript_4981/g.13418  ORF Transcript_4981/g.13418 Transcript_4981/m.13418 type:complete len:289 (+) Transcript_4981:840-1706(+)|eukprot:CAMPEP_0185830196 /NCGR_PEP_ID=MMETSP1353-20130828/680_1 /TAXON_ID=1077150 /ORGANISM="Erythrolobus australicus, Strain CCMP3124" /LENGTH=288 /DNA_ID=CAMNT_0028528061 /DNA_START=836 /DNA_END=1702 /DNA_ORIENTATION=-